jgi:glycine oxidase
VHAGAVVVAAGAWTSLVEGIGLPHDAVQPVRGQMVGLRLREPVLSRVVFTPRGYLVPRPDGSVLCGSTMERVGFDKRVTAGGVASILANALGALPGLAGAELAASWSGLRPAPSDGLPLLGMGAARGLFVASGHHRNGILLMPETARLVAECVLAGREPEALRPFSPSRFAR